MIYSKVLANTYFTIMRLKIFIQTFVTVAFGLGFVVFGIVTFIHMGNAQQQLAGKLESIRAGTIQPETLTVVRKYVDPGRTGLPHVVFSSNRQPKVNLATTVDFFNSVKLWDNIDGYYFPDGYLIPQNHLGDARGGKWFFLGLGVLPGAGLLVLAFATARKKPPDVNMDSLRKIMRDRIDGR